MHLWRFLRHYPLLRFLLTLLPKLKEVLFAGTHTQPTLFLRVENGPKDFRIWVTKTSKKLFSPRLPQARIKKLAEMTMAWIQSLLSRSFHRRDYNCSDFQIWHGRVYKELPDLFQCDWALNVSDSVFFAKCVIIDFRFVSEMDCFQLVEFCNNALLSCKRAW